ncbi:MAG: 6-phosphofructokinase, partial [Deltaproteobacteria bacterium]|nr:6-phosphofructokinase [Deltaproteobacteria bacterium]
DLVVGMDSSLNDMITWIDKFAEAAHARRRIFILHIKGEFCSCSIMNAALAAGVEEVIYDDMGPDDEGRRLFREMARGKVENIKRIIELGKGFAVILFFSKYNDDSDGSLEFIESTIRNTGITMKTNVVFIETTYGGIAPTVFDRTLAMRFGEKALATLRKKIDSRDYSLHIVGLRGKEIKASPYDQNKNVIDEGCPRGFGDELQRCVGLMSMPGKGCTGMGGAIKWTNLEGMESWHGVWTCKMCGHSQDFFMKPGRLLNIRCENPECANYGYVRISRRL